LVVFDAKRPIAPLVCGFVLDFHAPLSTHHGKHCVGLEKSEKKRGRRKRAGKYSRIAARIAGRDVPVRSLTSKKTAYRIANKTVFKRFAAVIAAKHSINDPFSPQKFVNRSFLIQES
jgi:hypothetical protein